MDTDLQKSHLTKQLSAALPDALSGVREQLIEFLYFLQKWNKAYNLTAITDPDKMLTHHLLDSLAIAPHLTGDRVLDVGTGAGFPGIPLAFTHPDKHFTLLDSNGKKTRFLVQAVTEFGLKNVEVVQSRVEDFTTEACFDAITTRAVGSVADIISNSQHLLCPDGHWFFMKGLLPEQELERVKQPFEIIPLQISGLDEERHLVIVS